MNNGTNNYGALKLTPSDDIVSRTLQARYRNYCNVIWRTGKSALDSEWNLLNDMSTEVFMSSIRSIVPSGWLDLGKNKNQTNSSTSNAIEFYSQSNEQEATVPNAIVNGWPILVGGANYTDSSQNVVVLPSATVERYDFVFLEVWKAQLRTRDPGNKPISQNKPSNGYIYKFGNVQYGGTNLVDDLIDPVFDQETSERVQVQYRIRVVASVSFTDTDSSGFEDTSVQAQGGGASPQVSGFPFSNMSLELGDSGLWRAGNGDEGSQVALKAVDGYTYAIPMFKIHRRSITAYSDTGGDETAALNNQKGNSTAIASLVSDRPDGKFHDGIDATDIIDLRNQVSLSGFDFNKIMEQNLDKFFRGELRTNEIQELAYNSISDSDVFGYNDFLNNMGASGKRVYWSDAETEQSNIFAEVKTSTTSASFDVYRGTGTGPWAIGDTIVVHVTSKLPVGTVIKATPRIHAEDTITTSLNSYGSWTGLGTSEAVFTFNVNVSSFQSYDLWVYYDIELPQGQGLTYVADDMLKVTYENASSFSNGTVVRGSIIHSKENRFQDLSGHTFENRTNAGTFVEVDSVPQRKQIKISPMIQTTTTKNGPTRTLEVETLDHIAKTVLVPYPLQHLRGVYTSATGGTELATRQVTAQTVTAIEFATNQILVSAENFVAIMTSLQYIPSGPGSEIELIGIYSPVFEHRVVTGDFVGTRVSLYTASGELWEIPLTATFNQFKWTGTRIRIRQSLGYGYDINGFVIDCTDSDNNGLIPSMPDRQTVWVDCDYLGAPHQGADLRIVYSYTPYQGSSVGNQELSLIYKRERGIFFNNGTGGGEIDVVSTTGTSNNNYSPVSPRLPGALTDYLRNGTPIEITSSGQKRFDSDFWSTASYDLYGYYGGGILWPEDYTMPATPEISQRGFLGSPMLEVIFEDPSVDYLYAEFVMPLLVKNKATGQLYLMVQVGNKGVHINSEGPILVDLFHLNERILLK